MPNAWLDDQFAMHPKVVAVGNEAAGMHARALSWCGGSLTDGHVPHAIDDALAGRRAKVLRDKLIAARLRDACDEHDRCSVIHDWHEINDPAEQLKESRRRARERKQRWREERRTRDQDVAGPADVPGHATGRDTGQVRDAVRDSRALGDARAPDPLLPVPSLEVPPPPSTSPEQGPASSREEETFDLDDHADALAALVERVHQRRPDWTPRDIRKAAVRCLSDGRDPQATSLALIRVANDSSSYSPARVVANGPWWSMSAAPPRREPGVVAVEASPEVRAQAIADIRATLGPRRGGTA